MINNYNLYDTKFYNLLKLALWQIHGIFLLKTVYAEEE